MCLAVAKEIQILQNQPLRVYGLLFRETTYTGSSGVQVVYYSIVNHFPIPLGQPQQAVRIQAIDSTKKNSYFTGFHRCLTPKATIRAVIIPPIGDHLSSSLVVGEFDIWGRVTVGTQNDANSSELCYSAEYEVLRQVHNAKEIWYAPTENR